MSRAFEEAVGDPFVAPGKDEYMQARIELMAEMDVGYEQVGGEDAVGIVVHGGRAKEHRPRAVAFVWGGKVRPQPSLPYGRWKGEVRPAA